MNYIKILVISVLLLLFIIFLYLQNNLLTLTRINFYSPEIPPNFHGYKILHLSDLHDKSFGKNQKDIFAKIIDLNPDIIVFTGDLINNTFKKNNSLKPSIDLMECLVKIAPTYYITGNHEWRSQNYDELERALLKNKVTVLRNSYFTLDRGNDQIIIAGLDDPSALRKRTNNDNSNKCSSFNVCIRNLLNQFSGFTILLSHRPDYFSDYVDNGADLILSGHTHGGQIRLPFLGGLFSPDQGLFPEYDSGLYMQNNSGIIVNRGLGNSVFPQRLFNRPEIILVTLTIYN